MINDLLGTTFIAGTYFWTLTTQTICLHVGFKCCGLITLQLFFRVNDLTANLVGKIVRAQGLASGSILECLKRNYVRFDEKQYILFKIG